MKRKEFKWTAIAWLMLGIPAAVQAQQGPNTSNVPVVASGQMPSSTPTANAELANTYRIGITAGTHFDDNALVGAAPRQWDVGYMLSPLIEFTETRPRLQWTVSYAPGVQISQNLRYRRLFSQRLDGAFDWLVSPHGLLNFQQYYLVSTNPFAQLGNPSVSPGPTIAPNEGPFIPSIRTALTLTNALYSYRLTEHTSFGIGGNFALSQFDSTPRKGATTALINSQRAAGQAYFNHQFSARESLGFQYGVQVLKFPHFDARTTTHTIFVFDQIGISAHSSLSIYGGPQYSDTFNQVELNLGFFIITIPVKAKQWSGAGGVIYSWRGDRFGATLDFTRGVSDGGGLVGAVELTSGRANLSWRLSQHWTIGSTLEGSSNTLLATQNNQGLLRYSARAQVTQTLARNLSMDWFYERLNQTGGFGNFTVGNHDLAGATLRFSVLRPIGR